MRELTYRITTFPENEKVVQEDHITFTEDQGTENEVVNLYPQMKYQTFHGFGGAVTDSAAYIYHLMEEEQKKEMLSQYFGDQQMKYCKVRVPLDSCDFSLEHFEASSEENQGHFSLKRMGRYIFPMLRDIQKLAGDRLEIMMTPWSPPAFMKSNKERDHGGKLLEEYQSAWAEYICRYLLEMGELGFPVGSISVQNEPKAVQTWDSCIFDAQEEKRFLKDFLYPALVAHGLGNVKIYIWDHNKERAFERACEIIDEETDAMIAGIAFHWYSGDHFDALQMIKERFPEKELMLSEACIEYSKFDKDDYLKNAQKYAHDLIGNLNHGLDTFYDWNLVLDEMGGPNHVGNYCDAPYLFDSKSGELMERNTLAYLRHFSHYLTEGAVRIGTTVYTEQLEVTAFETEEAYVVIMLNQTESEIPVTIRLFGEEAAFAVPAEAILTGRIEK